MDLQAIKMHKSIVERNIQLLNILGSIGKDSDILADRGRGNGLFCPDLEMYQFALTSGRNGEL